MQINFGPSHPMGLGINSQCTYVPKINNEKLFERYVNITHQPYVSTRPYMAPPLSDKITTNFNKPILLMDRKMEEKMANKWNNEINNVLSFQSLDYYTRRYPDRPWIFYNGVNVQRESQLYSLDYFNPRDCINDITIKELNKYNLKASINIMNKYNTMHNYNVYPMYTKKWFDNNTKAKSQGIIDHR